MRRKKSIFNEDAIMILCDVNYLDNDEIEYESEFNKSLYNMNLDILARREAIHREILNLRSRLDNVKNMDIKSSVNNMVIYTNIHYEGLDFLLSQLFIIEKNNNVSLDSIHTTCKLLIEMLKERNISCIGLSTDIGDYENKKEVINEIISIFKHSDIRLNIYN